MWRVIALSCVLAVVSSQITQVSQCTGERAPLPINVEIEGCVTPPCLLPQLQDAVMNVVFRAPRTIRNMRTLVRAYLGTPFGIPYPLGQNAETCNFITNSYCPVLENEVLQYSLAMYMESIFPVGVAPTLEFFVRDTTTRPETTIFCFRVAVEIIDSVNGTALSSM